MLILCVQLPEALCSPPLTHDVPMAFYIYGPVTFSANFTLLAQHQSSPTSYLVGVGSVGVGNLIRVPIFIPLVPPFSPTIIFSFRLQLPHL